MPDRRAARRERSEPELGDRYLLCSDGLSDMVDDDVIQQTLAAETIDFAATELIRLALEGGGYDNVTVVIAEMVEADAPADETLSSADGQPQLVGAAASQPRPRTGPVIDPDGSASALTLDPEEIRYAPLEPGRRRWIKWTIALLLLAAILAGIGKVTYDWTQKQYFVASSNGKVTIFRGVNANVPGLTLQHVDTVTTIETSSLPDFRAKQVEAGIEASSKKDAQEIVANLHQFIPAPTPSPSPTTPTPTKKATTKKTSTTLPGAATSWDRL